MKTMIRNAHESLKQYWRHMLNRSDKVKMSCGAQYITRIMTCAHGEGWRRSSKK